MKRIAPSSPARLALLLCMALAMPSAAFALEPPEALGIGRLPDAVQQRLRQAQDAFRTESSAASGLDLAEAYGRLAFEYSQAGLHAPAEAVFVKAEQTLPSDARWPYMRGLMLMTLQRYADAQAQFEQSIRLNPDYQASYFNLAASAMAVGRTAAAKSAFERAAHRFPQLAAAPAALARLAMADKRAADAVALLEKALSLDPQATGLYAALAEAHTLAGNASAAAAAQAKAGTGMPSVDDPLGDALLVQQQRDPATEARALLRSGDPERARAVLAPLVTASASDAALLTLAARIELAAGDFAAAKRHADRALALDPSIAGSLVVKGLVAENAKDDSQAQRLFQNAIAADPSNTEAPLYLGDSFMRQKHYARAAEQYRALLARMPQAFEIRARVLAASSAAGQCGPQLVELDRAIAAQPGNGNLMELYARAAASCSTASADQRKLALERAQSVYDARPAAEHSEALAMAMAANDRFDEAIEYQAQALFEATRRSGVGGLGPMQALLKSLEAGQRPRLPWPESHPLMNPPRIGGGS